MYLRASEQLFFYDAIMKTVKLISHPKVSHVFDNYPEDIRGLLEALRALIIETATTIEEIDSLEETLKWNEPSYLTKYGSTIRIDWKAKNPDQYAVYFKCTSKLVPTFKTIYRSIFQFEGNRAIIFNKEDVIPKAELKKCISAALLYHKVKHLPSLGIL